MTRHTVPGLTVADVIDDPQEMTAEEKLAEYERRVAMKDAMLAIKVDHLHSAVVKLGHDQFKHNERQRALLTEMRDSLKDLAKPDPVQDAILAALRAMCERQNDIYEALTTLIEMKSNRDTEH